jgi:hypothetical protein
MVLGLHGPPVLCYKSTQDIYRTSPSQTTSYLITKLCQRVDCHGNFQKFLRGSQLRVNLHADMHIIIIFFVRFLNKFSVHASQH